MNVSRGKGIAVCSSAIGLSLIAVVAVAGRNALFDWWYRIPVARTWKDLLGQTPIEIPGGIKVRLGIEATRCPRWSGVLLYCLTEGFEPKEQRCSLTRLGPLEVSVVEDGETKKASILHSGEARLLGGDLNGESRLLFAKTIPVPRDGQYAVKVLSSEGKLLGKVCISSMAQPFHPWLPFELDPAGRGLIQTRMPNEEAVTFGYVSNRKNGVALPRWEGGSPCPEPETWKGLARHDLPLPRLFPEDFAGDLKLKFEEGVLKISSDSLIFTARPDSHFLTRWWINGKPYIPEDSGLDSSSNQNGMLSVNGKVLHLDLDFAPGRIGARNGDRIGLQLLYLDHGWQFVEPSLDLRMPQLESRSLLSNKVEFIAP